MQLDKHNISLTQELGKFVYFMDSLRLSQLTLPEQFSHSMGSLSKYFNVENVHSHRALSDAETLCHIFLPLVHLFCVKFKFKNDHTVLKKIIEGDGVQTESADCVKAKSSFDITTVDKDNEPIQDPQPLH